MLRSPSGVGAERSKGRGQGSEMIKRIVVFAVLVMGYVLTGMALNAGQAGRMPATAEVVAD